tara:strand:+ start:296 stop:484 length:189 start_codon:yes stop_codon:yes gene_type:complete
LGSKRGRTIFADSEVMSEVDGVPSTAELTQITMLQVYVGVMVGVWPEGERIPFSGAIPFAIE